MKNQLELLVKLQSCDSSINNAQRIQENHPRMISQLEEALAREREYLQAQERLLDEIKKKRIRKEQELALDEGKVQKAKQKLTADKTNKEYQAALKEIELIEHENAKVEEAILVILEVAESLARKKAALAEVFNRKVKETEASKGALEKQLAACQQEIEAKGEVKNHLYSPDPNRGAGTLSQDKAEEGGAVSAQRASSATGRWARLPPW